MIRTLAWKEYREHRAVWAVMVVFAVGVIGALGVFRNSVGYEVWRWGSGAIGFLLSAMYAIICAAMVLAGEREAGTLGFLDSLSPSRTPLWQTKFWFGALLTMAQALVIGILLIFNGFHWSFASSLHAGPLWYSTGAAWFWGVQLVVVLIVFAVAAYAWSLLLSALCRTVLGAVGYAVLLLCLVCALTSTLAGALVMLLGPRLGFAASLLFLAASGGVGLLSSWWIYARQDTEREFAQVALPRGMTLLWLVVRQVRGRIAPLTISAIILGCLIPWLTWFGWPVVVVLLGVCCGIATFAGEQASGWRRFLGDQRLPPVWIWTAKTFFWACVAVLLTALMAILSVICVTVAARAISATTGNPYREDWQGWRTFEWDTDHTVAVIYGPGALAFWLAYGFACGLISTLIVRKTIVALLVGLLASGFFLALWVPSLTAGGVHWWQLYGLPFLCLASSYLLMRAWMSDRVHEGRALMGIIAGGVLAVLWMGGNFCYRAFEFPNVPPPFDVAAYKASMPTGKAAETGRLVIEAVHGLVEQTKVAREQVGPLTDPPFPEAERVGQVRSGVEATASSVPLQDGYSYIVQCRQMLERGWPSAKADKLGRWLDVVCQGKWLEQLRASASLPLGVVSDPALVRWPTTYQARSRYDDAAVVLAARALQLASLGENRAALDHISWILAFSRNLRHRAPGTVRSVGSAAEYTALCALYQWLDHPGLDTAILRRALAELKLHQDEMPSAEEGKEAEYVLAVETLADPAKLSPDKSYYSGMGGPLAIDAAIFTVSVPWEKERYRRLVNFFYTNRNVTRYEDRRPIIEAYWEARLLRLLGLLPFNLFGRPQHEVKLLRVSELMVALVLYEAENNGTPPPSLASLVPHYLAQVPRDPNSGDPLNPETERPFQYFISKDGWLLVNRGLTDERDLTRVPAGRGVIAPATNGEAGSYLVPPWRSKK
jgi:hypothetical protein